MEVMVNRGSNGEVHCCSVKKAKEIFRETEVDLNFGWLGKYYFKGGRSDKVYNFVKKIIQGKIIFSTYFSNQKANPILSFYLIKEEECTAELREEMETKYLPLLYTEYCRFLNDQTLISNYTFICIELFEGKLYYHFVPL